MKETMGSVKQIALPVRRDPRGDLTFIEGNIHVPFEIKRVYYLYNVHVDSERGGHAHRKLKQVLFAMSGSFRLRVDVGGEQREFLLRDPTKGILIENMVWRELDQFSQGAVCMVLASEHYDEADYIRNYEQYLKESK